MSFRCGVVRLLFAVAGALMREGGGTATIDPHPVGLYMGGGGVPPWKILINY